MNCYITVFFSFREDPIDFEEIDMDCANVEQDVEFVTLPEEKKVSATSTCPCACHESTTHAYSSRVKHCNKCCIKVNT